MSEPAEGSGSQRVADGRADAVIDLRYPEAQWTYRQLQARVADAHDRLAEAEADAAARHGAAERTAEAERVPETPLVDAQELIAREWSETAALSATRLVEADAEVRRIRETAEIEARAIETEAEFLRTHPVADPRSRAATSVTGVPTPSGEDRL